MSWVSSALPQGADRSEVLPGFDLTTGNLSRECPVGPTWTESLAPELRSATVDPAPETVVQRRHAGVRPDLEAVASA